MKFHNTHSTRYFLALLNISCLIFTSCGKEVYTGISEAPVGVNTKIIIQTKPAGAVIYFDDKNMGIHSNDSLVWLNPGVHKLTLKLDLFPDKIQYFSIKDGMRVPYFYNYYSDPLNFGSITCNSTPQAATIYLNDSLTNKKTNSTFSNLFPGQYKIKVTLAGCRADSNYITLSGGKNQSVDFILEDTTKWVSYKTTNSPMLSNYISKIIVDKNNIKWIGTLDQGLARFDGKNWKMYKKSNSPLIYDFITCLALDQNNNLWIGTSGGIMMFNGFSWINYTANLPTNTYVKSIAIDKMNNVWIGTMDGLVFYDGVTWKTFTTLNSGLAGNFVTCISIDNQNRVWLGTNSFGISMYDGNNWKLYNMSNMSLPINVGNIIQDIAVDNDGTIWAAHLSDSNRGFAGGITKYDGKNWSVVQLTGIATNLPEMIWVDKNNNKWIGTKNGLGEFLQPGNIVTFTTVNSQIPASQIESAAIDLNGDLYIGTFGGGAAKLKKGNF